MDLTKLSPLEIIELALRSDMKTNKDWKKIFTEITTYYAEDQGADVDHLNGYCQDLMLEGQHPFYNHLHIWVGETKKIMDKCHKASYKEKSWDYPTELDEYKGVKLIVFDDVLFINAMNKILKEEA